MILGQFSASLIPRTIGIMVCSSIVIIYVIAVHLGHQKPLPDTWISKCAQHYPQYLFFRVATISGAVLMILSYFINHFVIMQECYNKVFNIRKYHPQIIVVTATMGSLFLMGSTALIDTGKMNTPLHVKCAGGFFILTIFADLYDSYIAWIMYKKAKIGTWNKMIGKVIMAVLLLIQLYLDIFKANQLNDLNKGLASYLEFSLAFSVISYCFFIASDAKKYELVYDLK